MRGERRFGKIPCRPTTCANLWRPLLVQFVLFFISATAFSLFLACLWRLLMLISIAKIEDTNTITLHVSAGRFPCWCYVYNDHQLPTTTLALLVPLFPFVSIPARFCFLLGESSFSKSIKELLHEKKFAAKSFGCAEVSIPFFLSRHVISRIKQGLLAGWTF